MKDNCFVTPRKYSKVVMTNDFEMKASIGINNDVILMTAEKYVKVGVHRSRHNSLNM